MNGLKVLGRTLIRAAQRFEIARVRVVVEDAPAVARGGFAGEAQQALHTFADPNEFGPPAGQLDALEDDAGHVAHQRLEAAFGFKQRGFRILDAAQMPAQRQQQEQERGDDEGGEGHAHAQRAAPFGQEIRGRRARDDREVPVGDAFGDADAFDAVEPRQRGDDGGAVRRLGRADQVGEGQGCKRAVEIARIVGCAHHNPAARIDQRHPRPRPLSRPE